MTIILDGKNFAKKITDNLKSQTEKLDKKPGLAVIMAGDNPASAIYVRNKQKKAEEIGFNSFLIKLPEDISENDFLERICILNEDKKINAIMVQLPLPAHLDKYKILEAVEPIKDADGFTSYNAGRLALGYGCFAKPCTPKGIIKLLKDYDIMLEGKHAVVIGRSLIVGKPVASLLDKENATVTVIHSKTRNPKEILKTADIIIAAVGIPKFVTADCVKEGAVVVDVGINRTDDGLCGDVDFENVAPKASYITPVPGGIGPVTVAMLMENTFELFQVQKKFSL